MRFLSLAVVVVLVSLLSACKCGVEEQVRIHDSFYLERVLSGLNDAQVDYRIDASGAIWYCVDQRDIVKDVLDRELVIATSIIGFSDANSAKQYRAIFLKEGIESELVESGDGGAILLIPPDKYKDAKKSLKRN
jgi:hypothetical protein